MHMNDDAQCAAKFCMFLHDDGSLFLYTQIFKYFWYLNTSGQYLNTDTVFGI